MLLSMNSLVRGVHALAPSITLGSAVNECRGNLGITSSDLRVSLPIEVDVKDYHVGLHPFVHRFSICLCARFPQIGRGCAMRGKRKRQW